MKNTLAVIAGVALMGAAVSSYAAVNATIAANNYGANAGTITTDAAGTLLPTDAWVQVFATPAGGAQTAIGAPFHPSEPGYFDNGVQVIPGATAGSTVTFMVEAWVGATDFAQATSSGSKSWTQATGTWDDTPPAAPPGGPDMNMPGFQLGAPAVPEPTTLALAALGAAALFIRRRK